MDSRLDRLETATKQAIASREKAEREFKTLKIMVAINFVLTVVALVLLCIIRT